MISCSIFALVQIFLVCKKRGIRTNLIWQLRYLQQYKILKFGKNKTRGVRLLEEKKKYKKKNDFKINIIFNDKGEALDKIIERAFENYCLKAVKK